MGYRLYEHESVAEGVRRIARDQIDKTVAEITDDALGRHETVHQVRKRCKKMRALVRLVRPPLGETYTEENVFFRDAARHLSDIRDATALIETYDALMQRFAGDVDRRAFAPIRRALTLRRRAIASEHLDEDERLIAFLEAMRQAHERVATWSIPAQEYDAIEEGLHKTYRRGRKAMIHAYEEPTMDTFHEWRKRVKYHWYHMRLLREVWKPLVKKRAHALSTLASYLGDEHDLAVLCQTLLDEPDRFGNVQSLPAFLALLAQRRVELQDAARPLGARVFAETPEAFVRRFGHYWSTWRGTPLPYDIPTDGQALVEA